MDEDLKDVVRTAMTGRQIIEHIKRHADLDAPVFFVCDYGDRGHTQQALPVTEIVDATSCQLETTGYSQSGVAFRDENDRDEDDEPEEQDINEYRVIVLR